MRRASNDPAAARRSPFACDRERAEVVDVIRRSVLEPHLPGVVEQHVDDGPLRGSEQHLVDERLALVATAVAADQLHPRAGEGEVEDPRVRRVDEVEAHDLADAPPRRRTSVSPLISMTLPNRPIAVKLGPDG